MKDQTTKPTDLQVAQNIVEIFKPVVALGIEKYPFEPSVKGDICLRDVIKIVGSYRNIDFEWENDWKRYIPTTDQLLDWIIAFNVRQKARAPDDIKWFVEINLPKKEIRTECNSISEYLSSKTKRFPFNTPTETIKTAMARVVVEGIKIEQEVK